jgi:hypothetical protein
MHYKKALQYEPYNSQAQKCLLDLTSPASSSAKETFELQQWILANGGSFPKLCISAVVTGHRKVAALVPLEAHKEICCIPLACCISYQTAAQLPLAKHVLKELSFDKVLSKDMAGCRSTDLFAMYLLLDGSDTSSFHAPYYNTLPSHTKNFPACWSERELGLLEGSNIIKQVRARNCDMQFTFDRLVDAEKVMLQGDSSSGSNSCQTKRLSEFSFSDWQRVKLLVVSRNFRRESNVSGVETNYMLPFIDMLNHKIPAQTKMAFDDDSKFVRGGLLGWWPGGHGASYDNKLQPLRLRRRL